LALPGFRSSLIAGTLAAIGASLCCVAPLLLVFLVFAFRGLYRRPARDCATEAACANPVVLRRQRQAFWLVSPWLLVLLAIPWLAPLFY
jgi:mercuric ion transport protein